MRGYFFIAPINFLRKCSRQNGEDFFGLFHIVQLKATTAKVSSLGLNVLKDANDVIFMLWEMEREKKITSLF